MHHKLDQRRQRREGLNGRGLQQGVQVSRFNVSLLRATIHSRRVVLLQLRPTSNPDGARRNKEEEKELINSRYDDDVQPPVNPPNFFTLTYHLDPATSSSRGICKSKRWKNSLTIDVLSLLTRVKRVVKKNYSKNYPYSPVSTLKTLRNRAPWKTLKSHSLIEREKKKKGAPCRVAMQSRNR